MKNVQVIDGGQNCFYPIYQFTDEQFSKLFPDPGQDVEFIEDVKKRMNKDELEEVFKDVWSRLIRKTEVNGIHGTLFYELLEKKKYYPNKREDLSYD